MEKYLAAFEFLRKIFERESNGKLFKLAHEAFKTTGRGAIVMLYTQVDDVYGATGTVPASFLPKQVVQKEDGQDVADKCDEYNPKTQFVITISIGQKNDPDKRVLRKTFIIDYMGKAAEEVYNRATISIDDLENRLKNKKSHRCDFCGQNRLLKNLVKDPVIHLLVYCNENCYKKGWKENGSRLVNWYMERRAAFFRDGSHQGTDLSLN